MKLPLMAGHDESPVVQALPVAHASCVLPPHGEQSTGAEVVGSGVKPALQVLPAQTCCPLPPQMASQADPSMLSRNPVLQAVGRHIPVVHDTVMLLGTREVLQAVAQAPQLVAVLSCSQPLRALPSQLPKPVEHAIEHIPAAQEGVPPVLEQDIPQPPQWLVEVCVLTQPAPIAEQSTVGARQVVAQEPAEHRVPAGHMVPQPPQLLLSVAVLTHVPLHDT